MDLTGETLSAYAELSAPEGLTALSVDSTLPEPFALEETTSTHVITPPLALPVHLIRDGVIMHDRCSADDWVGAALVVREPGHRRSEIWRFHLVSASQRNDWTALLKIET